MISAAAIVFGEGVRILAHPLLLPLPLPQLHVCRNHECSPVTDGRVHGLCAGGGPRVHHRGRVRRLRAVPGAARDRSAAAAGHPGAVRQLAADRCGARATVSSFSSTAPKNVEAILCMFSVCFLSPLCQHASLKAGGGKVYQEGCFKRGWHVDWCASPISGPRLRGPPEPRGRGSLRDRLRGQSAGAAEAVLVVRKTTRDLL